jgi:hypothetical protein
MVPGVGKAFNIGRLANAGMSAYEASQLAPSRDARERSQDQFRTFEIADMNAPMQNTPQQSFRAGEMAGYGPATPDFGPYPNSSIDPSAYEGAMSSTSFPAGSMGGTANYSYGDFGDAAMAAPTSVVGGPIGGSVTGADLGALGSGFGGTTAGFGGGFGGGVGTGEFGGSPESASDLGYNQGGMVTPDRLMGRAPAPDDGYGALQGGEYVITKAAVEKYGKRLLDAINNGTFR